MLTIIATVLVVILVCVGVMHNTMLVTVTTGIGVLLLIAKIIFRKDVFVRVIKTTACLTMLEENKE